MFVVHVALLLSLAVVEQSLAASWNYDDYSEYGPSNWGEMHPQCYGMQQSPINIDPPRTVMDYNLRDFFFEGDWGEVTYEMATFYNNGYTVGMKLKGNAGLSLSGGGLGFKYNLASLHIHWGQDLKDGSEHTIANWYSQVEMHFVHTIEGIGINFKPGDLAVLGVMLDYAQDEDYINPAFEAMGRYFSEDMGTSEQLIPASNFELDFYDILPMVSDRYYRYNGSLTTPGCDELVIWTVFYEPVLIGRKQVERIFRKKFEITKNNRPIQDLYGRIVFRSPNTPSSFMPPIIDAASHGPLPMSAGIFMALLLVALWSAIGY